MLRPSPASCVCEWIYFSLQLYSTASEPIVVWLQKQLQRRQRRRRQSEIGGGGGGGGFSGVFRSAIPYKRGSSQRWRRARELHCCTYSRFTKAFQSLVVVVVGGSSAGSQQQYYIVASSSSSSCCSRLKRATARRHTGMPGSSPGRNKY
jgi:hypothetical protein